jgi:hypothetical protein
MNRRFVIVLSILTFSAPLWAQVNSATLSWIAPTENEDGSPLSDLSGYTIHWGSSVSNLPNQDRIPNPGISTYVVSGLNCGTTYFAISAFNSEGLNSELSNIASKSIPCGGGVPPNPPSRLTAL